jgi:hypothetical protein
VAHAVRALALSRRAGDEASFLVWEYERSDAGVGHWRLRGWRSDEYGEYASFAGLSGNRRDAAP